ncbi:MAG: hypothetical protein KAS32_14255 [Candidatus Peribacteraceae bacterium]|nr:hypothetical protein [Candidatus Peribacteraceae bacterium]
MDIMLMVALSLAIAATESPTYEFECGYYIDGILIHEGTPKFGGTWWGFATSNIIVIRKGLNETERMMTLAHETFHQNRMRAGIFNRFNKAEEERMAYEYGYNESNWDTRINRFHCIDQSP